ncbi:hypothetical protein GCM10027055_22820 [Janibacter alkaliphilus]|uniref:Uncharacterized protein n=1 Tax=Janibacter alkaliphilus TaxID=1069963 RepID=A0A852XA69_9MICO|nr:hypothetical protein [Janibacter alkaliphilus]NYG38410.1 hypothetical protein [Janibacter alkaliphilus]
MSAARRTTALATIGAAATLLAGMPSAQASTTTSDDACSGISGCEIVSRADVDGDGQRDSVAVHGRWSSSVGLRVVTATGEVMSTRTPISAHIATENPFYGAARIDGVAGYELVLMTSAGAHTFEHRVITVRGGELTTLKDPVNRYRWVTDSSVWSGYG